jgi:hypothetical protein
MEQNTYRDENDMGRGDAYWRRRAVTLAAGLGLLALLAWAFSGGGGGESPAPASSQPSGFQPAAAFGGPATPSPTGPGRSTGAGLGLASPSVSGPPSASPSPSPSPAAQQPQPSGPGGRCSPRALVLSLFTDRPSYYRGQYPGFHVYAVSTAAARCLLDLSPGKLDVVITSAGRVIWDSADCARGQPARVTELSRGVPVQASIVWNRAITLPGCVTLALARPGAYQVQARISSGGTVSSPVRTFRLARPALALRARSRARWPAPAGCLAPR